jgi:transposase
MRLGFYGLAGLVRTNLKQEPLSGDVFIFLSRRRNQVKLLQWDRDGFAIYYKRLEKGTYELPKINPETNHAQITSEQLMLILQGISLRSIRRRKRYTTT